MTVLVTVATPLEAQAAASPCDSDPGRPPARPVALASVAAELGEPFGYVAGPDNKDHLLADVVSVVRAQAAESGADPCYHDKPARIASRVDFLSPFEFLVKTMFDQDPARPMRCWIST